MPAANYVVICVHKEGTALSGSAAKLLVDYARLRCGSQPWLRMAVESFPGRGGTLLLARPVPCFRMAEYALPFFRKYARRPTGL